MFNETANILIVDDLAPNLLALEAVLEPLGQRIVRANSGSEALAALLREEFACILMDVQMPGMTGFEAAALIKQRPRTRYVPILFITAFSQTNDDILNGYLHGAVDFIVKPFHPDVMRTKVAVFVDLFLQHQRVRAHETLMRDRERIVMQREEHERERSPNSRTASLVVSMQKTFELLVESAPFELGVLDVHMRYERLNERLAALHGRTREEAVGMHLARIAPSLAMAVTSALEKAQQEQAVVVAAEVAAPDGQMHKLMITFDPTIQIGPAGIVIDVTHLAQVSAPAVGAQGLVI